MTSRPRTSRRRWSETFKKRVVSEASEPGVTVTQIARRYDLDARRVSNWIKKFGPGVALVPVEVTTDLAILRHRPPLKLTCLAARECGVVRRQAPSWSRALLLEILKLQLAYLRRQRFGTKFEALDKINDQLELALVEAMPETAAALSEPSSSAAEGEAVVL